MSMYSGEHDLCDHFKIGAEDIESLLAKTDIYYESLHSEPLEILSYKELVPYLPFGIIICSSHKSRYIRDLVMICKPSHLSGNPPFIADEMRSVGYDETQINNWINFLTTKDAH